jgi:uncharacterized membrane protein YfcA
MIEGISLPDLSYIQWILVIIAAFLIGASKTGISGAGMISIPILAAIFGGKMSAGLVLPMLSIADIFAVVYYNRHAQWKYVIKLLPWAVLGICMGIFVGDKISDTLFKQFIGIIVISSVGIMIWQDIRKKKINVPDYWWFAALMGFAGGFATMIGNAAGGIMALYLLSMRLPKNVYIGTGAWFFFVINLFKIPFHIFIWETITIESFVFDLTMIPALAVGAIFGIKIVKLIPERAYRIFIIVITLVSAFFLF